MSLDHLPDGHAATITRVGGEGAFRRRLMELGLVPGTRIQRSGQAPLGDPLQFKVRGAVLCLRRAEAQAIGVEAT